uniref:Tubulin-specific chaperone E n=1 Tax=Periophthalmus magnuspinnatus TaxID=409849 RepID=A0A3B4AD77_9GOBI
MAVDPEPLLPEDAVGRRVSCGGDRATVRYVGPVPPTKGVWLGVEWDNPERGKHDGVHEGVQYFTCSCPGSGSFVRPSKVSFGVDFLSVVHELYEKDQDFNTVGLCFSFSLENRRTMTLDQKDVNGPGEDGAIRKTTPNILLLRPLLLLCILCSSVPLLCSSVPLLNRLQMPSDPPRLSKAFLHLTVLNLSECALSWTQVMWVLVYSFVLYSPGSDLFQTLKSLSLSQNPLDQLSILSLSSLPRLEQLNLSKTQLSSIQFSDAGPGNIRPQTTAQPITWRVVNELSKLRSLVQLSCKRNHLKAPDGNHRTTSQLLIAKLGRLLLLNKCEIKQEERRGAELDYIKMFGEAWLKAGGRVQLSPDFITDHPRYQDLIQKYGAPEEGEMKKPQPFALKNQLLKISFEFPDDSERKRLEKKLPASMEVQKVKGLLHRLLKVPATELHLSYTSPKMVGTEFQLDNDLKSLQFYSIEAGDTVQVRWS